VKGEREHMADALEGSLELARTQKESKGSLWRGQWNTEKARREGVRRVSDDRKSEPERGLDW
jgi:hypothetical protein